MDQHLDPTSQLESLAHDLRKEDLLDHIQTSAGFAADVWDKDEFNDPGTYGYCFYKNLNNRLYDLTIQGKLPFEVVGFSGSYAFEFKGRELRFHRVKDGPQVPRGAKQAKALARRIGVQGDLFDSEVLSGHLIVGIVASPENGVRQVILGDLVIKEDEVCGYLCPPAIVWSSEDEVLADLPTGDATDEQDHKPVVKLAPVKDKTVAANA